MNCEICFKKITNENSAIMVDVYDDCAGQHAKSIFSKRIIIINVV